MQVKVADVEFDLPARVFVLLVEHMDFGHGDDSGPCEVQQHHIDLAHCCEAMRSLPGVYKVQMDKVSIKQLAKDYNEMIYWGYPKSAALAVFNKLHEEFAK
jgi:hypothetical protein